MQRSASDDLEANRTAISTGILRSSERVASAIANTINNNAITVSRPNLGTFVHMQHSFLTNPCSVIRYIYAVYYWSLCSHGCPAILSEQFQ